MIYLDSAATTLQKPHSVARAASWAVGNLSSPGRGGYSASAHAADTAFKCREAAAELFNVEDPSNVVITHSATHGLNIAIKSLVRPGGRVLISGYEHNAVTRPLHAVGAKVTVAHSELFEPEMALHAFECRLSSGLSAVICNHVSNVFGYILPIERIAGACGRFGVPLVIDASQSAGMLELDFAALGAAYAAMPGHKGLYGPQGTGLLLCNGAPQTIIEGGTGGHSVPPEMPDFLPDRLEAGTHNMSGIAGLCAGLNFVRKKGKKILEHERRLAEKAIGGLMRIDRVKVFCSEFGYCQTGVVSFIIDGMTCETVAEKLASRDIAVRAGYHCAPLAHRSADTFPSGTVRMSVSAFNTGKDISVFLGAVEDVVRREV